jgi:aryl-alcohol dehydrogenase-like predicted oxidoreductase
MDYRPLGRTGMMVSELCLGAMMFGAYGEPDHDESVRVIHAALDAGINFIDTADVYSKGESEEILAKALAGGRRDDIVLATKSWAPMRDVPTSGGSSRRYIVTAVEDSLRRLNTDWIDLYQVHRPDHATDLDETLGVLSDLVRQGKIRAFGHSMFPPHRIVEAQWIAERRGRERFSTEQPVYSILARHIEADTLPVCSAYGLGVLSWSPLGAGWLTGTRRRGQEMPTSRRTLRVPSRFDMTKPGNQAKLDATEELIVLADEAGLSLIHLALAFVLNHPDVTAPIIGPRTMAHLDSQLGAVDVTLSEDVLDRIDEIVPPGRTLEPSDLSYVPPAIADKRLRRRRA